MINIDWSKAPEDANWWAMDKNKLCYFYKFEPKILGISEVWSSKIADWYLDTNFETYNLSGIDWRTTLTRRPAAQAE